MEEWQFRKITGSITTCMKIYEKDSSCELRGKSIYINTDHLTHVVTYENFCEPTFADDILPRFILNKDKTYTAKNSQ